MTATERQTDASSALTWAEIDLAAVEQNYRLLHSLLQPGVEHYAVVKADAYGHGAVEVARRLEQAGADALCVARIEEAAELRQAGLRSRIIVMTPPFAPQAPMYSQLDAEAVVCAKEHVDALTATASADRPIRVHVKVDVGMGRLGIHPALCEQFLDALRGAVGVQAIAVMTHFPCADMPDKDQLTRSQTELFADMREQLRRAGYGHLKFHAANSAATMDHPAAHFDAVRTGIALYGQLPSLEVRNKLPLRPAMTLKTTIGFIKAVPAGTGLSYGHTFVTERQSIIATLALGYADGYPRHASNRGRMLVGGRQVPVVGRVCMDQTVIDVTDVKARMGDQVVVFGRDGDTVLRAEEVAAMFGTIGYELTTRIGKRVPRLYV